MEIRSEKSIHKPCPHVKLINRNYMWTNTKSSDVVISMWCDCGETNREKLNYRHDPEPDELNFAFVVTDELPDEKNICNHF